MIKTAKNSAIFMQVKLSEIKKGGFYGFQGKLEN